MVARIRFFLIACVFVFCHRPFCSLRMGKRPNYQKQEGLDGRFAQSLAGLKLLHNETLMLLYIYINLCVKT
uniref:Putative secreted protein n=1 Tax=Panstrongylus lignarius TaxID=156445 RepID=A0A224Y6F3_9HEMI